MKAYRLATHRHWTYPAVLENVDKVCLETDVLTEQHHLSGNDRFAVNLLLREALNNAVLHGCAQNPELTFSCEIDISSDFITIKVMDDGKGFNWREATSNVSDGTGESGRGLPIFRLYATTARFNNEGNCVILTRIFLKGERNGGF